MFNWFFNLFRSKPTTNQFSNERAARLVSESCCSTKPAGHARRVEAVRSSSVRDQTPVVVADPMLDLLNPLNPLSPISPLNPFNQEEAAPSRSMSSSCCAVESSPSSSYSSSDSGSSSSDSGGSCDSGGGCD